MGGPARHTVLLDGGLRARGHDTLLVHGTLADEEASFEHLAQAEGIATFRVASLRRRVRPWDDVRALIALWRLIRQRRPDVVHTHTAKAGALGRVAAALHNIALPRGRRCAIVHTFHGHVFEGYFGAVGNQLVCATERLLSRVTDCTIAISATQREDLVTRFRVARLDQTVVVPLGLRLETLLSIRQPGRDRTHAGRAEAFTIGYVGRLVPIKNLGVLLRAVALARREVPSARLVMTGDGPDRASLEELARELDISASVVFRGWQQDLIGTYGPLDVLALTSRNEGTPVAIIEAMAAGVPVIAPPVGGIPDVVQNEITGLLAPASPQAMADAIVRVARDPDGAVARATLARELVRSQYSEDALVDRMAALYDTVIARKRAAPVRSGYTDRPR